MKLAFVVQRYGEEISGGAELHCRLIAERFVSRGHEVHVYTTCARDYETWRDSYAPGITKLNGVTVHRFAVDYPRDPAEFNALSERVFNGNAGVAEEEAWMRAQGPYSTTLFQALKREQSDYNRIFFFCYLYATTYFGLPLCAERAILVPLAHDEPPIYLSIFKSVFTAPQALLYNTEEERDFIKTHFRVAHIPSTVVGMWVPDPLNVEPDSTFWKKIKANTFLLYVGRLDESKGCAELIRYFLHYKRLCSSDVRLVLMGTGSTHVPVHPDIVIWGHATEREKWQALRAALASVIPSPYESLSLSLLESFEAGRPVIVNGQCVVTKSQCVKSNGGLWYANEDEFASVVEYLRSNNHSAQRMGRNGQSYVAQNYQPEQIVSKYEALLKQPTAS